MDYLKPASNTRLLAHNKQQWEKGHNNGAVVLATPRTRLISKILLYGPQSAATEPIANIDA